jgi:hypothetical protein
MKEFLNYIFSYFKVFVNPPSRNNKNRGEAESAASTIIVWTIEPTRTGTYQIKRNGQVISSDYLNISQALNHVPRDHKGVVGFGDSWEDYYEE